MEPILKGHFTNFKNQFEIVATSTDQESKAFEKFVNYVLFSLDYPDIFTADVELLDVVSVGGGNDTGIDGLGIKVNDRIVRDIEEVEDIAGSSRKLKVDFVFIQSKMRSSFDTSEFNTFGTGIKVFFSDGFLPENSQVSEFRKIKDFILSDQKVISKLEANPSLSIYYVTTGTEPTDEHFLGAVKWLESELGDPKKYYFDNINIKLVGGKQIIRDCRELENKFEAHINTIDIFPLIVDSDTDVKKAYAFTCSAREFLKIIEKEDGLLRRSLFNDNVRDYLGNKGAVNSEIEKTIANSPEMFLLCNNGVTIVCRNFELVRDKLVKIEDPQIVNGCQTSNSLFNLRENPNIDKVQLLVRLISTESPWVSNKIVYGTNKQNQVLEEAFEATRQFHQFTLEPFFLAFDHSPKLFYERRAKQYNEDPLIKKTHIVNLRILTQTFVGMFLNAPHVSHRHEAKLLELYAGDDENRRIYKEDHPAFPYYVCALTWYMFEKYFREGKIPSNLRTYRSHLYLTFKNSIGEFQPPLVQSKRVETYCRKLVEALKVPAFDRKLKEVLDVFDGCLRIWTKDQSRSRHGIKDNKDFTELLLSESRKRFIQGSELVPVEDYPTYSGNILRVIFRDGVWFGFIDRGYQYDNVYFDSRGFRGDVRDLLPGLPVSFELCDGDRGPFGRNVVIIE